MKSLLVAAGLCVGMNDACAAVGDVHVIYSRNASSWVAGDIGSGNDKWTSSRSIDSNNGLHIVSLDNANTLQVKTRGKTTCTGGLTLGSHYDYSIVTIDAIWNTGGFESASWQDCSTFTYGDFTVTVMTYSNSDSYTARYTLNGSETSITGMKPATDYAIHLVVNSLNGAIEELTIKTTDVAPVTKLSISSSDSKSFAEGVDYSKVIIGTTHNANSSNSWAYLKSITVSEEEQDVPRANVTFKYADTSNNSLSDYQEDQVMADVAQGATISALIAPPYTNTFFNGTSNKYVYAGEYEVTGDYTTVQAGGNTITLKFTDYPATTYTVMAQSEGVDITPVASGTAFLDGSTTAYYSKYFEKSSQWYETSAPYGVTINNAKHTVDYISIDEIDYFYEIENMNYSKNWSTSADGTNYSNGSGKGMAASANCYAKTVVNGGVYTVIIKGISRRSGSTNVAVAYRTPAGTIVETGKTLSWTNTGTEAVSMEVTGAMIPAGCAIALVEKNGSNQVTYMDYVTLKKTGEYNHTVPVEMGANGYATFASVFVLDLTNLPTGLKAYTASLSGNKLSFNAKDDASVTAGTGLLLKGDAGETYEIPVAATGAAVEGNALTGVTAATDLKSDAAGNYIFVMKKATAASDALTFLPLTTESDVTVPAGKAYVSVAASAFESASRALTISFGDEATGISSMKVSQSTEEVYDLQGRRVAQPTKGLYIVNGKKVIIK